MKRNTFIAVILLMVLGMLVLSGCSSGPKGDGVTTCINCGRSGVVLYGYFERCAKSFTDWQKKQGY